MKPLIKKINGVWCVFGNSEFSETNIAAMAWCHNRNIQEGNYSVKTKAS